MVDDYLSRVKSIPILDVCHLLGVEVIEKSGKYWCKLRPSERTASTLLHTENAPNSFHDFGGAGEHGDVIHFVSVWLGLNRSAATKFLAEKYDISSNPYNHDLTNWEYEKIGLYGDIATKNFTFDLDHQSVDRVSAISEKYGMSMNDLRVKHPQIYEKLLYQKAIPFVRDLRNEYYLDVFFTSQMLMNMRCDGDFSKFSLIMDRFSAQIKNLKTAERILMKAAAKTGIKAHAVGEYDPNKDLERISSGEIKLSLGSCGFSELKSIAKEKNDTLRYRSVSVEKFNTKSLEDFSYSAFLKNNKIVVGFLESDRRALKPILDTMIIKKQLGAQIADAEIQKNGQTKPEDICHSQSER